MGKSRPHRSAANDLLALLPADDLNRLLPKLSQIPLQTRDVLYQPNVPIDYIYFPERGMVSLVALMESGARIEVATIGAEGLVGLPAVLGVETATVQAMVQMPGTALRIATGVFRAEMARLAALRQLLTLYQGAFLFQVMQTVACNGLHPIRQRCCRWLLLSHDRAQRDEFPLTHEFLALMLGVRRSSITEVLRPLQAKGLIRYQRGTFRVLDRRRLEGTCCECYQRVRQEYERLFG
ncbi:MAG: Crp/Fnr family transcriptional regulator [Gemmataceae bacterium]